MRNREKIGGPLSRTPTRCRKNDTDASKPKSTVYKNKRSAKVFREWQMSRVVQVPLIDSGGLFKDWTNLHKVDTIIKAWTPIS